MDVREKCSADTFGRPDLVRGMALLPEENQTGVSEEKLNHIGVHLRFFEESAYSRDHVLTG